MLWKCGVRILGIGWTRYQISVSILKDLGVTIKLSKLMLIYFKHAACIKLNNLEKLMVVGQGKGLGSWKRFPTRRSDWINTLNVLPINKLKLLKSLCTGVKRMIQFINNQNKVFTNKKPTKSEKFDDLRSNGYATVQCTFIVH